MLVRRRSLVLFAFVALAALAAATGSGCHRKVEPYDASEQPKEPDLSKIFPAGSERAMGPPSEMPPSPEELMAGGPAGAVVTAPAEAGAPISGTIQLAEGAEVPPGATLFVIARTGVAGPPTAVLRLPAPSFPFEFRLGPENRMIAEMPWEGPFMLSARIDLDGNATTRDVGGLEGRAPAAAMPGATGIAIRLGPAE